MPSNWSRGLLYSSIIWTMGKFNLDNRQFQLLVNSDNGAVSDQTTFHYTEEDGLVTATYAGGSVIEGQIIGKWISDDQLDMRYHCILQDHSLKAGKAIAQVIKNNDARIELHLDWQWLGRGDKGKSVYIETK